MTATWAQRPRVSSHSLAVSPSGSSDDGHGVRGEGPVHALGALGVDLRAPVEHQRRDDHEDHEQHQPGARGVGAEEPGLPALLGGVVAEPDEREDQDPDEHQDREQVLEEAHDRPGADDREREVGDEQLAEGLDDREGQDEEPEEDEDVGDAGHAPLEQLLLAEDLGGLHLDAGADLVGAAHRRLPGSDQPLQEPRALEGQEAGHHNDDQADRCPDQHHRIHVRKPPGQVCPARLILPSTAWGRSWGILLVSNIADSSEGWAIRAGVAVPVPGPGVFRWVSSGSGARRGAGAACPGTSTCDRCA